MIAVSAAHESRSRVRCCVCIERRLEILLVVRVFKTVSFGCWWSSDIQRLQLRRLEVEE